jgi:ubiquinone/menaquinone biosynthesis C-methylase UbiE
MKGATPEGADSEREAAAWVRGMFGRVAHRYDLANHLLSLNIDRLWRARAARRVAPVLARPGARVLDICCGTGDLAIELQRSSRGPVLGSDFCHPMLLAARRKIARPNVARRSPAVALFESDALQLPLRDGSLDLLTVAFGFRNLANYAAGLAEMRRVLRPGGRRRSWNSRNHPMRLSRRSTTFIRGGFCRGSAGPFREAAMLIRICRNRCGSFRERRSWRKTCGARASAMWSSSTSPAEWWRCTWAGFAERTIPEMLPRIL